MAAETEDDIEARIRKQIAELCLAEYTYWRDTTDESIEEFSMGAMGAASNILAAVLMKTKPDVFRKQVAARDGK